MFGNILSTNGRANSKAGTRRNMDIGTKRNKSETVRSSCLRSRRVSVDPCSVFFKRFRAVLTSAMSSYGIEIHCFELGETIE